MSLEQFLQEMLSTKSPKNIHRTIDGKNYFYQSRSKSIFEVTGYKNNISQITHSSLERHINDKVELINFVRDYRGDSFDDGGFCFYVGKYNGRYILGSNYVSYNNEFSEEFININILEESDENVEYKYFDSLEDINVFLEKMIIQANDLTEEDEEWGYNSWDLEEENFESPFMHLCIRNLGSAFCEFPEKDILNILNLTISGLYSPDLLDSREYYDSWIEDQKNLLPILKST
jgi:hypothetical protein